MNDLTHAFSPHKVLSKSTMSILAGTQLGLLILLWVFSPFVFFPSLSETWNAFLELWDAGLPGELVTSFSLNAQAIGLACLVSLGLAYATVMPFFRPMVEMLSKLRFLSMAGLSFFFTLAAKSGHELKLYLLIFSISVFFVTSMADVLANIPRDRFDLARTLRMGNWRIVWEVVVLGQTDKAFEMLRQNAAIGWMMLTMVEGMSRSEGGVGALLLNQNKHFHLAAVMAIQMTILALGLAQDYALGFLRTFFCPYADLSTERK